AQAGLKGLGCLFASGRIEGAALGPRGGVVTQRSAKPFTPVQFWSWPPNKSNTYKKPLQPRILRQRFVRNPGRAGGWLLALAIVTGFALLVGVVSALIWPPRVGPVTGC